MRRYLIAGLLVWVPVGVTILVLRVLLDLMDRLLLVLPPGWRPEALLGFRVPGLGVLLALLVLLATGMLVANLVGRRLVSFFEGLLHRIPLVRSVYSASKGFAEVVFSETGQSFKKVLLIEYPRAGCYSVAFQTSAGAQEITERMGRAMVCVFVPSTPNPTSGYIVFVPRAQVTELAMDVEEALKMIISLGVVTPQQRERVDVAPLRESP